jgi:hypothetical protein
MHALCASTIAIFMGIHAVLGCSWHMPQPTTMVEACCPHHYSDEHSSPSPSKCGDQCAGACTYLPPERTLIDTGMSTLFPAAVVAELSHDSRATGAEFWFAAEGGSRYGPAVRLHLLKELLLI